MLRTFKGDLHIHTCLSPCAGLDMGPKAIVARAVERGLDMIGISDHNSCENAAAVMKAAWDGRLKVLPGVEVTSREEVHILALFEDLPEASSLQQMIYEHLPGENQEDVFGLQVVVNEDHEVVGMNKRLLAGASALTVEQVVDSIHALEGVAIASHFDRPAFGIVGQLGFVPGGLELDALELSPHTTREDAQRRYPEYSRFCFVRASDAHCAKDIGAAYTSFLLSEPTLDEIKKALRGVDGRQVEPDAEAAGSPPGE